MARWQFYLADSKDLSNTQELTQARGRTLSLTLNQPGTLSFTYPITDEFAPLINPIVSAIKAYRNGVVVWSGFVSTIDEDISGNRMQVTAVGWLARLDRRVFRIAGTVPDQQFTDTDDADIIYTLLERANGIASGEHGVGVSSIALVDSYTARWPSGSSPNVPTWIKRGSKLPNEGPGGATSYVAQARSKKIDRHAPIGSEIQQLVQIENGCDIEVDPVTRELNIYRKKTRDLTNVVFGYRWGPNNIERLSRQIDGATVINYMRAIGSATVGSQVADDGSAPLPPALPNTYPSQTLYGLLEEVATLSDVRDTNGASAANILAAYAAAEVYVRQQPRQIYSLTPYPHTTGSAVFEPFAEYELGDRVYFSARQGQRVKIDKQAVRVFGIAINIDEEGNERVQQLQLTP